ncbi:MAG: hypothetical protein NC918_02630 [Candidatus Omnitrophica bacterium]|nr:hypothetical protein [Candidatus Omnitrophota bacterium]
MRIEIEKIKKIESVYVLYGMRIINEIRRKEYRFLFVGPTTNYNNSSICKKYIEKYKQDFFCFCKGKKKFYITVGKYPMHYLNALYIAYEYNIKYECVNDKEEVLVDFENALKNINLKEVKIIEIK